MVISAAPLKIEFNRNTEMRSLMLKYTQALMAKFLRTLVATGYTKTDGVLPDGSLRYGTVLRQMSFVDPKVYGGNVGCAAGRGY